MSPMLLETYAGFVEHQGVESEIGQVEAVAGCVRIHTQHDQAKEVFGYTKAQVKVQTAVHGYVHVLDTDAQGEKLEAHTRGNG